MKRSGEIFPPDKMTPIRLPVGFTAPDKRAAKALAPLGSTICLWYRNK
jgi:hypothetical protein